MIINMCSSLETLISNLKIIKQMGVVRGLDGIVDVVEDGCILFRSLYVVGCQATQENVNEFKNCNNTCASILSKEAAQLIADNRNWLLMFFNDYRDTLIHDVCHFDKEDKLVIKSGIKFMNDLFSGTEIWVQNYTNIDTIFEIFRPHITDIYYDIGQLVQHEQNFINVEIPQNIPSSHFWWFNSV